MKFKKETLLACSPEKKKKKLKSWPWDIIGCGKSPVKKGTAGLDRQQRACWRRQTLSGLRGTGSSHRPLLFLCLTRIVVLFCKYICIFESNLVHDCIGELHNSFHLIPVLRSHILHYENCKLTNHINPNTFFKTIYFTDVLCINLYNIS